MIPSILLILSPCFFLVATVCAMLGLGGGVFYTPIQVLLGVEFHTAATTSLFLIVLASAFAAPVFHRARKIDWHLSFVVTALSGFGSFCGALFSGSIAANTLVVLFAVTIAIAGAAMICGFKVRGPVKESKYRLVRWSREMGPHSYVIDLVLLLPIAFLAGGLSGLIGIGGGVVLVPAMVLLCHMPTDLAIGSSAVMVGISAFSGFAGHVVSGHWDWQTSCVLAISAVVGSHIGANRSIRTNESTLKKIFGYVLLVIAITMGGRAFSV